MTKNVPISAYLALGSNLGNRAELIASAVGSLNAHAQIEVLKVSDMYETAPVGAPGQGPYLNAAAEIRTTLNPRELLETCLVVERAHGRDRRGGARWGPRLLDIDLLVYGTRIIDEPGLCVPHPHMLERLFVLVPLAQIAPDLVHPVSGMGIQWHLEQRQQISMEPLPRLLCLPA
jgi:2-amino-4-hydroxy-6-hydroxymethyldihydropteridine diphosphokinase